MSRPPSAGFRQRPAIPLLLILAVAYFVLGRLALLLAIPPGFASSVWPAAGAALMALLVAGRRLWPGVLLGSFLVNLPTALGGMADAELVGVLAVPAAIGAGAALQAMLGAWAIERWVGFPNNLANSRDILTFLALGGPASCVISATVGVLALRAGGLIDAPQTPFHWWTWWVGDSIGVLVVVPLALAVAGRPDHVWRDRRRRVVVPLVIATTAVVMLFVYARRQEARQLELELGQRALSLAHTFEKHTDRSLDDLKSIEGMFASSPQVSRVDFRRFTSRILGRNPTFQALSWNPLVPHERRAAYEAEGRADGFPGYQFTEAFADGLRPAAVRPEYVVVHYIEPYAGNRPALGFNIASNASRRDAIERARDSGRPATTPGIRLVQETGEQTGVLILMPVYADGAMPDGVAERRQALRGYATGVLRVGDALRAALAGLPLEGFAVTLWDRSDASREALLAALPAGAADQEAGHLGWSFERDFGGRTWALRLTPVADWLAGHRRWYAWLVLAGGLVLVSLLGVLLLLQSGRAAELAALNARLEEGMGRRQRLEKRHKRLIGELELRNAELERFSYTVSHDLKSPLITIKGYLGLIEKDLAAGREAEVDAEISQLHRTVNHMRDLLADLLQLSRAGHVTGPVESLPLGDVAREVATMLTGGGSADGAHIEIAADLPRVRANRGQLHEVLQNLLDNALKFMGDQPDPRVEVGAVVEGDRVICHVKDNGIGLDSVHCERIFGLFTRLDQRREGTGVGLALVRRMIEMSGGSVWADSPGKGKGSTFCFILPRG